MTNNSPLLINEPPLQVIPSLAVKIGLNEAIVLQQFHYWLQRSNNQHDGYKWIYNSYPEWNKQFSFWSESTVKRTITSLENQGLLISSNFNKAGWDRTKWYRIDYGKLVTRASGQNDPTVNSNCTDGSGQNDPAIRSNCTDGTVQDDPTNTKRLHKRLPETSSDTSSKEKVGEEKLNSPDKIEVARTGLFNFWEQNGFGSVPPLLYEKIDMYVNDFRDNGVNEVEAYGLIQFALSEAVEANARRWNYVEPILKDYLNKQIVTVAQAQSNKAEWQQRKQRSDYHNPQKPVWDVKAELKKLGKEVPDFPF